MSANSVPGSSIVAITSRGSAAKALDLPVKPEQLKKQEDFIKRLFHSEEPPCERRPLSPDKAGWVVVSSTDATAQETEWVAGQALPSKRGKDDKVLKEWLMVLPK